MMYAMKYVLPLRAIKALGIRDTYSLHRAVYSLFDDVRGESGEHTAPSGILFADKGLSREGHTLLVLADRMPRTPEQGTLSVPAELREDFFSARLYRFEIVVNPVRKDKATGKRVPVKGRSEIAAWFAARCAERGISVVPPNFSVDDVTVDRFEKNGSLVTLEKARITGVLSVEDRALFQKAVCTGIGHGKAFGCGMLQVAPLSF